MDHSTLLSNSIAVCDGMITYFPQFCESATLHVSHIVSEFDSRFAINNSTVAFICGDQMYVTPYTDDVVKTLADYGYHEDSFYVPFSNWDYPRHAKEKWEELRTAARKTYTENA